MHCEHSLVPSCHICLEILKRYKETLEQIANTELWYPDPTIDNLHDKLVKLARHALWQK